MIGFVEIHLFDKMGYSTSPECVVDSDLTKISSLRWLFNTTHENISTTIQAMVKWFVSFCLAQDGESTDMNCLVFYELCENDKFLTKRQVYNKGIFVDFGYFFIA